MEFSSISKVTASSTNLPEAKLVWKVNVKDVSGLVPDSEQAKAVLLYNNLMYDLVGAVLGKLGWEYSRLLDGEQDRTAFDAQISRVQKALINE
jgi:hypothetical protein